MSWPLHIAVDARELAGKPTGVGRYLRGLLDAWTRDARAQSHRWTLYAHDAIGAPFGGTRRLPGHGGSWWEQRTLASALRADRPHVLFAPAYTAPLFTSVPRVVTIHDLSYFAHPEWFHPREGLRRRVLTARAAHAARLVLTVSAFSKDEIVGRLGVPRDKVRVIAHGVEARPPAAAHARAPVVLHVGSIFNRRHVPHLIRGFARLARRRADMRLEIVGENRTYPHEDLDAVIAGEEVADRVRVRAYVDDATLNQLYAEARALAWLSEYEGFGLAPIEALAAGVPPLVLGTDVAREVCGTAAEFIRSWDPADIELGLDRVVFDESVRARILSEAPLVLLRYQWDNAARKTLDAIEQAAS